MPDPLAYEFAYQLNKQLQQGYDRGLAFQDCLLRVTPGLFQALEKVSAIGRSSLPRAIVEPRPGGLYVMTDYCGLPVTKERFGLASAMQEAWWLVRKKNNQPLATGLISTTATSSTRSDAVTKEPELVVGPVHAWRVFKVKVDWGNKWFEEEQMELALASISASHVYTPGVNVSKNHPGNATRDIKDTFGRLAFHGHDRGFWAMGSLGWLMQRFRDKVMRSKFDDRPSYVIGEVTLSGAIAGHEQGWYAEELAVERLICARNVGRYANPIARLLKRARHDEHVHALGEVYDVPVVCSTMDKADLDDRLRGVCHAPLWKKEGPWNSDSNDDASKSSGGAKTPSPMAIVGPRQYEELTKKLFQQGPKPSDTPLLQELPSKVRQQLGLPPDVG